MRSDSNRPPFPPLLVLSLGILVVSTASIMIRYAQQEAHSLVIAAYRLSVATLLLTPYALRRHWKELRQLTASELILALISGVFLAIHFATWISSLAYTSVVSSIVIVQSAPLWVALLAPLFLHEAFGRRVLWGLILALVGGAAVSIGDICAFSGFRLICPSAGEFFTGDAALGNVLALAGAMAAAGYIMIGRKLRARLSLIAYIYLVYGAAALILVVITAALGYPATGYSTETYIWMVLLALGPQLIGHSSFNWALRYLPASFVSITFLGESIGAAILALILLNEVPTVVKLTGAALILLGIYLASGSFSRKNARPSETHGSAAG